MTPTDQERTHVHGSTPAAWVANGGIVVGATIAAVGIGTAAFTLVWIGAAVAAFALVAGGVLKALGHGKRDL